MSKEDPKVEEKSPINTEELFLSSAQYDYLNHIVHKSFEFRGKTLTEWSDMIKIPNIENGISMAEIEDLNLFAIKMGDIVNENLGYSKSSYDLAAMNYEMEITKRKAEFIRDSVKNNAKKMASDLIDTLIRDDARDIFMCYKIAELYYEFWKIAASKLKSLDGRLTSLSMLSNYEKKHIQK